MDSAFDNYLILSKELRNDLLALLESESGSQHWRRNFVRVSASLIEGHAQCLRDMCTVSFDCISPPITANESNVLKSEDSFSTSERIKYTLRAAYKLFEINPVPNFGGAEWSKAQRMMLKRHSLMHPKTLTDLEISDELWIELHDGATWLIEQMLNIPSLLQKKYGSP